MDKLNQEKFKNDSKAHVSEAASELLKESKKLAHELYEQGLDKACDAQKTAKETSDELVQKIKKNPLASVLIAAGAGFLLSSILRK